jgi:hypothetical protein
MFIRLKKPTFVMRGTESGLALPREVLFNLSRVGTVSFGTNSRKLVLYDNQKLVSSPEAGQATTIQIDIDGDLGELLEGSFVQRRVVLIFAQDQQGEFQRIRRILESHVVES